MDKPIIDIIDKKAARQYDRLTPVKRKAYRAMLYAGAQITMNGYSVKEIAVEIGYSESGTSKLAQKWIELMRRGDVTVNLIISAIRKLPKDARFRRRNPIPPSVTDSAGTVSAATANQNTKSETPSVPAPPACVRKDRRVLGFLITREDRARERSAIRSSILFFQTYGKGTQPRTRREYYTPGTHIQEPSEDNDKWLPLETAAIYCGCRAEVISRAGQNGVIERRIYRRRENRNYYEYKISDLDKFINDNHLI